MFCPLVLTSLEFLLLPAAIWLFPRTGFFMAPSWPWYMHATHVWINVSGHTAAENEGWETLTGSEINEINVSSIPVMISILTYESVSVCLISSNIVNMEPWVPRSHLFTLELTAVKLHRCWFHNSSQEYCLSLCFVIAQSLAVCFQSSGSFTAYCWVSPSFGKVQTWRPT